MDTKAIIMHDGSTVEAVISQTANGNETVALYFLQIASALIDQSGDFVVASGRSAGLPSIDPALIKDLFNHSNPVDSGMKFETFKSTYVKKAEMVLRLLGLEDSPMAAYNYLQDCHADGSVTCWNLQTMVTQLKKLAEPETEEATGEATEEVTGGTTESQQDKLARLQQILTELDSDSLTVAAHMVEAAQVAQTAVVSDDRIYNEAY